MTALARLASPIARAGRLPLLAPLRVRDFRLVWFGESVSLLGDQFHLVALSWLVLGLTGSGLALGTVLFAAAVPRGIFVLLGGVLSDRFSPRALMFWSNLIRAAVTTVIAALVLGARIEIWQLVLAGVLFGTVDAFFYPAISTIVARLVPVEQLAPANAMLQGTQQLMGTIGPAVAGVAIAAVGVGAAFVVDAASFAIAALAVWLVAGVRGATADPAPSAEPVAGAPASDTPPAGSRSGSMLASMGEGARVVLADPLMRMIVLLSASFNVAFTGPIVVGLPWLVQVRFVGDSTLLGVFFAAFGGGSLIGVILAGTVPSGRNLGTLLVVFATALGLGLGAIGLAPAPLVALILFLIGTGVGYMNIAIVSWAQARTDPRLLGRTMSFLMLGGVVGAPVSLAVAGAAIDLNATGLFLGAGGLVVATAMAALATGLPRRMV
jgi:hypothetical protein